jgi:MFS family permease
MRAQDGLDLEPSTAAGALPIVSPAARRYALGLLFCAYVVNYVDRQVVTILQDPIKADLGLSDTQLGFVTGLSFALFYAMLGVPIARLADLRSRKHIIAVSMALWSVMTAACAATTSFATLLLCRVGVGVGEAGLTPPAHSLISDYYPPARRSSALAIYSAAGTVGLMVGYMAGGWLNLLVGWRMTILIVGAPGILLALLVRLTLREPRRGQYDAPSLPAAGAPAGTMWRGLATLWRNPAFRCLGFACGFHTLVTYGQGNWVAPFFGRVHHMSTAELGSWMALLSIGPGLIGMLAAGYLTDWLVKRRPHARMEVAIGSVLLIIPFEIGAYVVDNAYVSIAMFAGSYAFAGAYLAPSIATAHMLVPSHLRASASAVIMLGINLIGLGMGPLIGGFLSDQWIAAGAGDQSLRYAMLAIIPSQAIALILFARVMGHETRARR